MFLPPRTPAGTPSMLSGTPTICTSSCTSLWSCMVWGGWCRPLSHTPTWLDHSLSTSLTSWSVSAERRLSVEWWRQSYFPLVSFNVFSTVTQNFEIGENSAKVTWKKIRKFILLDLKILLFNTCTCKFYSVCCQWKISLEFN